MIRKEQRRKDTSVTPDRLPYRFVWMRHFEGSSWRRLDCDERVISAQGQHRHCILASRFVFRWADTDTGWSLRRTRRKLQPDLDSVI
jgi:hypothetical protein